MKLSYSNLHNTEMININDVHPPFQVNNEGKIVYVEAVSREALSYDFLEARYMQKFINSARVQMPKLSQMTQWLEVLSAPNLALCMTILTGNSKDYRNHLMAIELLEQ